MTWICVRGQIALATQELVYTEKPFSTEGCTYDFEPLITPVNTTYVDTRQVLRIFNQISQKRKVYSYWRFDRVKFNLIFVVSINLLKN